MTQPTHVSGTIKPLEWSNDGDLHRGLLEGSGFGRYCVWVWQDAISGEWVFGGNRSRHPTLEAAQAAAQASYEARILAQIQPDAGAQPVASSVATCATCAGTGEVVTNWDEYLHPPKHAEADHATETCPACDGEGAAPTSEAGELVRRVMTIRQNSGNTEAAALDIIRALPAARAEVSVAEAAGVLLGDGGMMPTPAKLAAVKAHLQRDSRVQPVAIIEAWNAALRALTEAGE